MRSDMPGTETEDVRAPHEPFDAEAFDAEALDVAALDAETDAGERGGDASYRQILRSSSIIGGASALNIVVGLVRTKVAAVLLGPAGVGLIGLLQSVMATGSTVATLGFDTAGTRQIAEANGRTDDAAVAAARRGLFWGALGLALLGGAVLWMLRGVVAQAALGDAARSGEVAWLALGVALTVAAGSQSALLTGLRRIGDLARMSVLSAVLASALGVGALWIWGQQAVLVFVLAGPLANVVLGHVFVSRLPRIVAPATPLRELAGQWRALARLGAAFMVAGLVGTAGQLVVRTLVQRELGVEALGHFQAAWAISMTYIGFILSAMGADYYPRLTAAIHDLKAANRMVNQQVDVAVLLAAPVFLAMLGLAPLIIEVLYSARFAEAAVVLRWQVLGDVLKVVSWPLGFVLLASGDGRTFMLTEILGIGVFVAVTWLGLPLIGIEATGIAFVGMYAAYLPVVYALARRRTGFRWDAAVLWHVFALVGLAATVSGVAGWHALAGAGAGVVAGSAFGLYSLTRLGHMATADGRIGQVAATSRRLLDRLDIWRD
jgi:PST family polysaccharide transporter